jgi:hypothetical protein
MGTDRFLKLFYRLLEMHEPGFDYLKEYQTIERRSAQRRTIYLTNLPSGTF